MKIRYIKENFFDDNNTPTDMGELIRQEQLNYILNDISHNYGLDSINHYIIEILIKIYYNYKLTETCVPPFPSATTKEEQWHKDATGDYKKYKDDFTLLSLCIWNILVAKEISGKMFKGFSARGFLHDQLEGDHELTHDTDRIAFNAVDISLHPGCILTTHIDKNRGLVVCLPLSYMTQCKSEYRTKEFGRENLFKYILTQKRLEILERDYRVLQRILENKFNCPIKIQSDIFLRVNMGKQVGCSEIDLNSSIGIDYDKTFKVTGNS